MALWRAADREPWLPVTGLSATLRRCTDYRHRTWEEELFRDLKSFGWQLQRSRVRRPERVEPLLLALALATVLVTALAQRVLKRGWRPLPEERCLRCYSIFQLVRCGAPAPSSGTAASSRPCSRVTPLDTC